MAELPAYTADELDERARAIIRLTQQDSNGVRNADVKPGSDYDIWARLLRAVALMFQSTANGAVRALDPRQAFGQFIRQYADNFAIGTELKDVAYQAQAARGYASFASTNPSDLMPGGTIWQHGDATQFSCTGGTTPFTATKLFHIGHRSTRSLLFQGELTAAAQYGEVYLCVQTGENVAVRDAYQTGSAGPYRYVQPWHDLALEPVTGQLMSQRNARVMAVTAVLTGPRGNKQTGDRLSLLAPVGGYTTGTILSLTGGRDALTPAQVQQAIKALYGTRMETMTLEQIRKLALATPNVDMREAYVMPGKAGTFDVYPIGQVRCICTEADADDIREHIQDNMSAGDHPNAVTVSMEPAHFDFALKVSPDFAPDWDFSATNYPLSALGANTTVRMAFTFTLPTNTIAVGNRVILSIARGAGHNEDPCLLVRKVTAVGANYIDVDTPLPYTPSIAWVSQGGPYAEAFIAAVDAFFDAQGPYYVASTFNYYRHPQPDSAHGAEAMRGHIMSVPGVLDAAVSDLTGAAITAHQVYFPKAITVRAWA